MTELNLSEIIQTKLSTLLNEGRLEDVKARYHPDQSDKIDYLSGLDPSGNNKYLAWLAKNFIYSSKDIQDRGYDPNSDSYYVRRMRREWKMNGLDVVVSMLKYFEENPQRFELKDINQYRTLKQFQDAAEVAKTKLSRKQMKSEGAEKVYDDDNFTLIHPKTHEASCKYGARTRWCVTMRGYTDYFERYSTHGPLFFLIDKRRIDPTKSMKTPDYYKIALHYIPRFNGRMLTNEEDGLRYAKSMSRDEFISSADIGTARLDFWNVQDKKVNESVVLKYLGGPGRGQGQRGTETINIFKPIMERYTKKILGDYWDSAQEAKDITEEITGLQTEVGRLERKIRYYGNMDDYLYSAIDRLENLIGYLESSDEEGEEDDTDVLNLGDFRDKVSVLQDKRDHAINKMEESRTLIREKQEEINKMKKENSMRFSFYDIKNNKKASDEDGEW